MTISPFQQDRRAKQDAFLAEYVRNGYSAAKAIRTINPKLSVTSSYTTGPAMLKEPYIAAKLLEIRKGCMQEFEITEKRILQELAALAFLDIADILNDDGSIKPISEIPEAARRALAGLDIVQMFERCAGGSDHVGDLKKIKLESKRGALELLGKYFAMFKEKVEHTASDDLAVLIADARDRAKKSKEPEREADSSVFD